MLKNYWTPSDYRCPGLNINTTFILVDFVSAVFAASYKTFSNLMKKMLAVSLASSD